jgi:hypothetical protein
VLARYRAPLSHVCSPGSRWLALDSSKLGVLRTCSLDPGRPCLGVRPGRACGIRCVAGMFALQECLLSRNTGMFALQDHRYVCFLGSQACLLSRITGMFALQDHRHVCSPGSRWLALDSSKLGVLRTCSLDLGRPCLGVRPGRA